MRFAIAVVAGVLLAISGFVILFLSTGEMRTFGWVILFVGLLFTGINLGMRSRMRRP